MTKKHNALRALLSWVGLLLALGVIVAALLLDARIPDSVGGLIFGLAGMLAGISGTAIIMDITDRKLTSEERKEIQRGETDERNVAIREKAAYSSWYWTLYLLWGLFVVCLILGQGTYIALVSVVITLHSVFLMMNIHRWGKKM